MSLPAPPPNTLCPSTPTPDPWPCPGCCGLPLSCSFLYSPLPLSHCKTFSVRGGGGAFGKVPFGLFMALTLCSLPPPRADVHLAPGDPEQPPWGPPGLSSCSPSPRAKLRNSPLPPPLSDSCSQSWTPVLQLQENHLGRLLTL